MPHFGASVCVCVYRYSKRFRSCFNEAGGFAIQYLSGFLDITRGAWTSVRNSVRVTFCQSLVACSKKARPIINHSTSWPRKLGQAIGIAFLEILNIVYSDLLKLQEVHAVLEQIRLLFQVIASDERIFEIHQSDIIWRGFLQPSGTWSDSSSCWFRDLSFLWSAASIFGIFYTDTHSQVGTHTTYFSGSLAISEQAVSRIQTVSYSGFGKVFTSELILPRRDPSFSSTSWCVYGLTMGAYFMFCCCINERVQLFQVYPMLLSQPYFAHRYVDNRAHQEIFSFTR